MTDRQLMLMSSVVQVQLLFKMLNEIKADL